MIRSKSLHALHDGLDRRLLRLQKVASGTDWAGVPLDRRIAYATIESLSVWSSFAREYYLSCAWLTARCIGGARVFPGIMPFNSERDAILFAISVLKPPQVYQRASSAGQISPRDEPVWHDNATLVRLWESLSFSNITSVASSFSYPTTFFRHCPPVRNFFAHRNFETAQKVRRLASGSPYLAGTRGAAEFVGTLLPGRQQTLIEEWIDDLRLIGHGLCA